MVNQYFIKGIISYAVRRPLNLKSNYIKKFFYGKRSREKARAQINQRDETAALTHALHTSCIFFYSAIVLGQTIDS